MPAALRPPLALVSSLLLAFSPLHGGVESLLYGAPTALSMPGAQGFALLLPGATGAFGVFPALTAPDGWAEAGYRQFFRNNLAATPLNGQQGNGALTVEVPLERSAWGLGFQWQFNSFADDARDVIALTTGDFKAFDSLITMSLRRSFPLTRQAKASAVGSPRAEGPVLDAGVSFKLLLSDWGQKVAGISTGDTKVLAALIDGGLAFTLGKLLRTAVSVRHFGLPLSLSNLAFNVPLDLNVGAVLALPTGNLETDVGVGWQSTFGDRQELSLGGALFLPLGAKPDRFSWRRLGATAQARLDFEAPERGFGFGGGLEAEAGSQDVRLRIGWGLATHVSAGIQQSFSLSVVWNEKLAPVH